jgi:hypothetical protein
VGAEPNKEKKFTSTLVAFLLHKVDAFGLLIDPSCSMHPGIPGKLGIWILWNRQSSSTSTMLIFSNWSPFNVIMTWLGNSWKPFQCFSKIYRMGTFIPIQTGPWTDHDTTTNMELCYFLRKTAHSGPFVTLPLDEVKVVFTNQHKSAVYLSSILFISFHQHCSHVFCGMFLVDFVVCYKVKLKIKCSIFLKLG